MTDSGMQDRSAWMGVQGEGKKRGCPLIRPSATFSRWEKENAETEERLEMLRRTKKGSPV
jgi:hypothetical protein